MPADSAESTAKFKKKFLNSPYKALSFRKSHSIYALTCIQAKDLMNCSNLFMIETITSLKLANKLNSQANMYKD